MSATAPDLSGTAISASRTSCRWESVQVLDHAPSAHRLSGHPASTDSPDRWRTRRALGASVVLAIVLGFGVLALIGPGVFTVDETAYRTQAELADGETGLGPAGWGLAYPSDEVVVQRLGAPFVNAELGEGAWYAYARHPFYVEVVGTAERALGHVGPAVVSLLSVVAGAAALEIIARRRLNTRALTTFWFVVAASPVMFHAFVVWAHALTFGLFAVALLVALEAPARWGSVACGSLVFVATLLRSDSPIAALALAGLLVWVLALDQRVRAATLVASILTGIVAGRLVDGRWAASIIDDRVPSDGGASLLGNDVLGNFVSIVVLDGAGALAASRIVGTGLLVIGALWIGRDRTIGSALAGAGLVLALVGASSQDKYLTLFAAAPAVWPAVGVALISLRRATRFEQGLIAAGFATIAGAVIASPYGGGGAGWGGRYALTAFVFFIPVAVAQIGRAFDGRDPIRWVLGAALVATAAVQWTAIGVLDRTHAASATVTEQLEAELPGFAEDVDLLVTVDPRTGRLAPDASRVVPLVTVDDDEIEPLLAIAADAGVDRIAFVGVVNEIRVDQPAGWESVERDNIDSLQYWILELEQ